MPDLLPNLLSAGDDYELVFTAPSSALETLSRISSDTGVTVTEIGEVVLTPGVVVIGVDGDEVQMEASGYQHF